MVAWFVLIPVRTYSAWQALHLNCGLGAGGLPISKIVYDHLCGSNHWSNPKGVTHLITLLLLSLSEKKIHNITKEYTVILCSLEFRSSKEMAKRERKAEWRKTRKF